MFLRPSTVLALLVFAAMAGRGMADPKRVEKLIRQMGSEAFAVRERAMQDLEALGAAVLPTLRQATQSADVETARRAAELVRRLEEKVLVAQAQAPKRLHLRLADTPVLDAVKELAQLSGYALEVTGDRTSLLNRKVKLDTGPTTFWEALDRLGAAGGVTLPPSPAVASSSAWVHMEMARLGRARLARVGPVAPSAAQERLELVAGLAPRHVSYTGACRVELRLARHADGGHELVLDAAAEPRLLAFTLIGTPALDEVLDGEGRPVALTSSTVAQGTPAEVAAAEIVTATFASNPVRGPRQVKLLLGAGAASGKLRKLSGTLPARVTLANELLASADVEAIVRAAGNLSVSSRCGGVLQVHSFEKLGSDYRVQVALENLGPNPLAQQLIIKGNLVIQGNVAVMGGAWSGTAAATPGLPDLVDAEGRKYQVTDLNQSSRLFNRQLAILYRPQAGQGPPVRLAYYGTRLITIPVPFSFHDVALD